MDRLKSPGMPITVNLKGGGELAEKGLGVMVRLATLVKV
jgi:hypothetical protein